MIVDLHFGDEWLSLLLFQAVITLFVSLSPFSRFQILLLIVWSVHYPLWVQLEQFIVFAAVSISSCCFSFSFFQIPKIPDDCWLCGVSITHCEFNWSDPLSLLLSQSVHVAAVSIVSCFTLFLVSGFNTIQCWEASFLKISKHPSTSQPGCLWMWICLLIEVLLRKWYVGVWGSPRCKLRATCVYLCASPSGVIQLQAIGFRLWLWPRNYKYQKQNSLTDRLMTTHTNRTSVHQQQ